MSGDASFPKTRLSESLKNDADTAFFTSRRSPRPQSGRNAEACPLRSSRPAQALPIYFFSVHLFFLVLVFLFLFFRVLIKNAVSFFPYSIFQPGSNGLRERRFEKRWLWIPKLFSRNLADFSRAKGILESVPVRRLGRKDGIWFQPGSWEV